MQSLFSKVKLHDVHENVFRNIVSLQKSQDLFDDLSDAPEDWALAQQVEDEVKPPTFISTTPIIHRPFEDAHWFNAITWPFQHWQASRYSNGQFGVWYGAESVETTAYETAYHWYYGLLADAGFQEKDVRVERKVYTVACDAALLDLRPFHKSQAGLMHKTDYSYTQAIGTRLHREGHPGLITHSVRNPSGHCYVILNPTVLSDPRHCCQLSYRVEGDTIYIEKQVGSAWMSISVSGL